MSDYIGAQKAIALEIDSTLEIVTTQGQKLGLASSGSLILNRPDKVHAMRSGGFADVELVYDGKKLSLLRKDANIYIQVDAPASIDLLVDELRDKYRKPVPAADLLMSDVYSQLMPLVVDVKDLGSGVIRGVECNHLAFRTKDVDWQIWIAKGDKPLPAGRLYGPQCEIAINGTAGDFYDEARRGTWWSILTKTEAVRTDATKAAFKKGEWNLYRIVVKGDHYQSFVNGLPAADFTQPGDPEGYIGFQVHGIKAGTGPYSVRWRDVKFRETK